MATKHINLCKQQVFCVIYTPQRGREGAEGLIFVFSFTLPMAKQLITCLGQMGPEKEKGIENTQVQG